MTNRDDFRLRTGRPHESSGGELTLAQAQRVLGFLYDFEFNVSIRCDQGFDDAGRALKPRRIVPDLVHRQAQLVVEVDGSQHYGDHRVAEDDIVRTALLEQVGWTVMRIPSTEVFGAPMEALLVVLRKIEKAAMLNLIMQDQERGLPQWRWRILPIGGFTPCAECGKRRAGYAIGSGHLCIRCAADLSNNEPYRPPAFECSSCGRHMTDPADVRTWPADGNGPVYFTCPGECLDPDDAWD